MKPEDPLYDMPTDDRDPWWQQLDSDEQAQAHYQDMLKRQFDMFFKQEQDDGICD